MEKNWENGRKNRKKKRTKINKKNRKSKKIKNNKNEKWTKKKKVNLPTFLFRKLIPKLILEAHPLYPVSYGQTSFSHQSDSAYPPSRIDSTSRYIRSKDKKYYNISWFGSLICHAYRHMCNIKSFHALSDNYRRT